MIIVAVDPGLSGAVACVCSQRGLLELADLPVCANGAGAKATVKRQVDGRALLEMIGEWSARHDFARDEVVGVIERIVPFGKANPSALLSMGYSAGMVEGVLAQFVRRIEKPAPKVWKRRFGLTNDKARSAEAARALCGDQLPKRLRHDKAEAVLLGRWGVLECA